MELSLRSLESRKRLIIRREKKKLEDLEFQWIVKERKKVSAKLETQWNRNVSELKTFYDKNEYCSAPKSMKKFHS